MLATSPLSTFQEITIWSTHTAADTYDYFSILSSKPNHDYEVYYTSRHKDRGALKEHLKAGKTEIPQSCMLQWHQKARYSIAESKLESRHWC